MHPWFLSSRVASVVKCQGGAYSRSVPNKSSVYINFTSLDLIQLSWFTVIIILYCTVILYVHLFIYMLFPFDVTNGRCRWCQGSERTTMNSVSKVACFTNYLQHMQLWCEKPTFLKQKPSDRPLWNSLASGGEKLSSWLLVGICHDQICLGCIVL